MSQVPTNIDANTLEQTACDALTLTEIAATPVDLEAIDGVAMSSSLAPVLAIVLWVFMNLRG